MVLLQVHLPPRPLLCTGDFKIKEAIHHQQHVMFRPYREKGEMEWPSAHSFYRPTRNFYSTQAGIIKGAVCNLWLVFDG